MDLKIRSVRAKDTKPPLTVITVECEGEIKKYTVSEGTYRDIGCPLSGEVMDEDTLAVIEREDEERRALAKALSILSYSDNNERRLLAKLRAAGFSSSSSVLAVKECVMHGYVNEERQIENLVRRYYRELAGPSKIVMKIVAKGYPAKRVHAMIDKLSSKGEIDFEASRAALIEKKYPDGANAEEIRKLLYKNGYTHD